MGKCKRTTALLFATVIASLWQSATADTSSAVVVYQKDVPRTSSLLLDSKYRAVDYKIEGRFIGTHDGDLIVDSLEPGRYTVVAEKKGCSAFEQMVYINKNTRDTLAVSFDNAHSSPVWMAVVSGATAVLGTVAIVDYLTNDELSSTSAMGLMSGIIAFSASGVFGVKALIQVKRRARWEEENVIAEQNIEAHMRNTFYCGLALEF